MSFINSMFHNKSIITRKFIEPGLARVGVHFRVSERLVRRLSVRVGDWRSANLRPGQTAHGYGDQVSDRRPAYRRPAYLRPGQATHGYREQVSDRRPAYLRPGQTTHGYGDQVSDRRSAYLRPGQTTHGYRDQVSGRFDTF